MTNTMSGDHGEKIDELTRAIGRGPEQALPYVHRGATYRLAGDNDRATEDLTRAIELDPGVLHARTLLSSLRGEPTSDGPPGAA